MDERQELDLLRRARTLDPDALSEIHDRYYSAVYRYISFRISNLQTAEDLTSEVFTRLLQAIRDRRAPSNTIRGWLYGAAARVVKEQYRRQRRAQMQPLSGSLPSQEPGPEQALAESLRHERLRQTLTELTEEQQDVLSLRFGAGLSIKETAAFMGKSEGAVKMLQARAVAALARRLTAEKRQ